MTTSTLYFRLAAAAFTRGKAIAGHLLPLDDALIARPLDELMDAELDRIIAAGLDAGLRLHKFKRTMGLPRVRRVCGALRAMSPVDLLDIGSGRGAFLWPLLDEFRELPLAAVDCDPQRVSDLQAVRTGGFSRLTVHQIDATALTFPDAAFDVVTALEVLEHIPAAERALAEILRVARRFVVLSVPSQDDDNPQHIHLFDQRRLRAMLRGLGAERVSFDYVPGHLIAVVNVAER